MELMIILVATFGQALCAPAIGISVTGVLIFFFLFAHVLDTALVRVSPDSYNRIMDTYKTPLVNLMEIGLFGAVLFHALPADASVPGTVPWTIRTFDHSAKFARTDSTPST